MPNVGAEHSNRSRRISAATGAASETLFTAIYHLCNYTNLCTTRAKSWTNKVCKGQTSFIFTTWLTRFYWHEVFYRALHHRLAQTLLLVPYVHKDVQIHWIIVEDAEQNSVLVRNLLTRTGLDQRSTLLFAKTPSDFKLQRKDPSWSKPRGVAQRNEALKWIRNNVKYTPASRSAIYFMDDDNTYSTQLFEEIKKIGPGKVAVWPVGLVGGLMVEKPVLDTDNRVLGFNSAVRLMLSLIWISQMFCTFYLWCLSFQIIVASRATISYRYGRFCYFNRSPIEIPRCVVLVRRWAGLSREWNTQIPSGGPWFATTCQ